MSENNQNLEFKIHEVARRIVDLREAMNLSQEELAKKIGLDYDQYVRYESGEEDFPFTFIYKIANTCKVDMNDLLTGESPALSEYVVTRKGEGSEIVRREGFMYQNLAPNFKNKLAEPFYVKIPYSEEALNPPYHFNTHVGQEMDIVIKGNLKMMVGDSVEILHEGDAIYYDSSTPHNEIALGGEDCEIYAVVMNPEKKGLSEVKDKVRTNTVTNTDLAKIPHPVYEKFVETTVDENGIFNGITYKNTEKFNFAFDIVDEMAKKNPSKTAMVYLSELKEARRFTFKEMSEYSNQTANYFKSLGIGKGDKVLVVLKRHYQFWFTILALHKLGAIIIPATHLLKDHDFEYRFNAAHCKAIVCTGTGDVADQAEFAAKRCPDLKIKICVDGLHRKGWHNFNDEFKAFSKEFEKPEDFACGDDTMLMFFTSGTTGYPKIAAHNFKYPLGHFPTAKFWHNVDPNGLHFTIADTGWGKALWGKLYGQWMCEAATFVYDFEKFKAEDILPLFKQYNITTFCAPTTMYRFFIKEDLTKYDLSSIKYATVAGEAMNPEVYNQFLKATGVRIMEGFGQTETTLSIANFVGESNKVGSMGRPSPLYDIDIVDPDGNSCKVGETGEIVISTQNGVPNGLFQGYFEDEEKTKEVWHDGYYHTGDTAWKDEDGFYWYVGRVDDVIKSSGYRIGPFEIESVIMELPYVLECAVVAAPDEIRGQVVKANIVLTKGTVGTDELKKEIQTYVKEHTAPYKYPRIVEFRDELPKTISGKIRRVDLR